MKKYIITGGPNSGKTSIIKLLAERGYATLEETSKLIKRRYGTSYWNDPELFCALFRLEQIHRELELPDEIVFLEGSLVGLIACAVMAKCGIDRGIYIDINKAKYERTVFFLERLPLRNPNDWNINMHLFAMSMHKKLLGAYSHLGFRLVNVPLFSIDESISREMRLKFILDKVNELNPQLG